MTESAGELLRLVRAGRASTRSDLRRLTGMSRTAVVTRVDTLLRAGLLLPGREEASTGGRPPGSLVFNRTAGVVLAAAVGRSRTQLAVLDLTGAELACDEADHEAGAGPATVMPDVVERLRGLLAAVPGEAPVLGVGLSLPGSIDPALGISVDSPVVSGWDGVELAPYLEQVTRAPLWVGNDADVLALSELLGHARTYDDLLVVKASTGLGLGIVVGGEVVRGALGGAGEIGHTPAVTAPDGGADAGLPCRCGRTGCLETVAAGWALVAERAARGRPVEHVRELVRLAQVGEAEARGLLRESGRRLGETLALAITLLNPSAVVVGGDMAGAYDTYLAGLRESVYARSTALATRDLVFLPSTYGDRAGVVGCGAMALEGALAPEAVDAWLTTG
ncbi:ROK family protein [uncultured Nocardioides sp.]|uniref:ROK family protein n=1 Tax=uncultured Nocardioides sp. TaxID=198441 RepID=UPI002627E655|nr:ROK family protein [uncultured Nocardioides sp.]